MAGAAEWGLEELRAVRDASAELVKTTPLVSTASLSAQCGGTIALKAENLQRTGSFKLRGALAKLRSIDVARCRGVVAGSAGNHAQALAYAARASGVPCTVFMPEVAAVSKAAAVSAFGATVRVHDGNVDECVELAHECADRDGLTFVHPFDDVEIVKGQAGLGIELLEQSDDLACVVIPVGGGGLASGAAIAVKLARPDVRVIGVRATGYAVREDEAHAPAGADTAATAGGATAQRADARSAPVRPTIADGIAIKRPGPLTARLLDEWLDDLVTVEDGEIAEAMVWLVERAKIVAEGAGAAAVAALRSGAVQPTKAGTTVAVVSGGNVDPRVLAGVIDRHEAKAGRRVRLFTEVPDRPGGLAGLLQTVADAGGNVIDVMHVRDSTALDVSDTGLEIVLETRGEGHLAALTDRLGDAGYRVRVFEVGSVTH